MNFRKKTANLIQPIKDVSSIIYSNLIKIFLKHLISSEVKSIGHAICIYISTKISDRYIDVEKDHAYVWFEIGIFY